MSLGLRALLLAALLLFAGATVRAQDVQPVPALTARVIDTTGTLAPAESQALEQRLAAFEAEAGPQIVLLLVTTTAPEDIAAFAQRVADSWKIGRREVGDGVLVLVAKNDRRVRIEVAKALEGAIPDLAARQIIERTMREPFREGRYGEGLGAAVEQIQARIRGENLPAPETRGGSGGGDAPFEELLVFFFVGVAVAGQVLTAVFGRKLGALLVAGAAGGAGWWLTASALIGVGAAVGALVLVGIFGIGSVARRMGHGAGRGRNLPHIGGWNGGGWGGGGGGWGGGGGFSSGGGGDFGGGGASGDW